MAELNDFMAEFEAERLAQIEREEAARNTPEAIANREAKRREEFEKGVRLGWWDKDGNSLIADEEEGDEEEAEDED